MKDMGLADVILRMKILRTSDGIIITQSHYVEKILKKFNAYDGAPVKTPIELDVHLSKNKGEPITQEEYARVIGCIMYLTNCTRPDIACAVNKLSRYTSNPSKEHWRALVRVLRYLKHTQNHGLHFSRYPPGT